MFHEAVEKKVLGVPVACRAGSLSPLSSATFLTGIPSPLANFGEWLLLAMDVLVTALSVTIICGVNNVEDYCISFVWFRVFICNPAGPGLEILRPQPPECSSMISFGIMFKDNHS